MGLDKAGQKRDGWIMMATMGDVAGVDVDGDDG